MKQREHVVMLAAGTMNSDEARDLELKLKDRFYLQPLTPSEAAARAKESAKDIVNVKSLIEKKAWPYVQNDLRSKASYLRYDLNTVISAKSKDEKKSLKELTGKLFQNIDNVSYFNPFVSNIIIMLCVHHFICVILFMSFLSLWFCPAVGLRSQAKEQP